jgi:putative lipoic acid-binding regulatory protein
MSGAKLEYPCAWPLKVMGRDTAEFRARARTIVERHVGPLADAEVAARSSSAGNFLALTFAITAESREQLDALYLELSSCPDILVAL